MSYPIISADSHITEAPNTYVDYIDKAWKDKAPRVVNTSSQGDVFVIDGMDRPIALGLVAAAGKDPDTLTEGGVRFEDLHRGGWDPEARMAEQDRDGVAAEVIYPTVGMMLCNHKDFSYKDACFAAYNRWIAEYCSAHPARLLGQGQSAATSPDLTVRDLHEIKKLGLRGVMMSGNPGEKDFDSEIWNPVWEAAIELNLPVSFHILTIRGSSGFRGPRINSFLSIIRGNQDIMGTLIFGGVFERYPRPQGRVRRSRRRVGSTLYVPHGSRLQAASQLVSTGYQVVQVAERVLRGAYLHHLPGRLGRVQVRGPDELAAAHVGQRLSPLRFHVALVPRDARRAHGGPVCRTEAGHSVRKRCRLYQIDLHTLAAAA